DFHLRASVRPNAWEIHASAADQKILLKIDSEGESWQKTLTFSDLQHPESLLQELGGADTLGFLGTIGLPLPLNALANPVLGLRWEAHEDRMQFGHSKVRVYRLETRLLGQHIYVFVSRVGEILWVELPNQVTLRNDAFSHF